MTDTTMTEQQYLVGGMTCGHCVASVTEEISELVGVTSVSGKILC
jgi:copper chaperone